MHVQYRCMHHSVQASSQWRVAEPRLPLTLGELRGILEDGCQQTAEAPTFSALRVQIHCQIHICIYMYILHVYIYMYICMCIYVYILRILYMHIYLYTHEMSLEKWFMFLCGIDL